MMMSPAGGLHGRIALRIAAALLEYERRTGAGHAIGDNVGFVVDLPGRRSFSPDVAYHFGLVGVDFISGCRRLPSKSAAKKTTVQAPSGGWRKSVVTTSPPAHRWSGT